MLLFANYRVGIKIGNATVFLSLLGVKESKTDANCMIKLRETRCSMAQPPPLFLVLLLVVPSRFSVASCQFTPLPPSNSKPAKPNSAPSEDFLYHMGNVHNCDLQSTRDVFLRFKTRACRIGVRWGVLHWMNVRWKSRKAKRFL